MTDVIGERSHRPALETREQEQALNNLRRPLAGHDGPAVADLAAMVL